MARGKTQIRKIENSTRRQVTFSKRRNGLFKKANELAVLCDASVSVIIISSSGRLHEYISPPLKTKQFFNEYKRMLGIDLWSSHYERMQEQLKKLKEVNWNLRTQIRQRMGECLNNLNFRQLSALELDIDDTLKVIRERKVVAIKNQAEIYKKKIRNEEKVHVDLLHGHESLKSTVIVHSLEDFLSTFRL